MLTALLAAGLSLALQADADRAAPGDLGVRLLALWREGEFEEIAALGEEHRGRLLGASSREYLPLACVARSLPRLGRDAEALDWFEGALGARPRDHVLAEYVDAAVRAEVEGRARRFLAGLRAGAASLSDARAELELLSLIARGDDELASGRPAAARRRYRRALALFGQQPWREVEPRARDEREISLAEEYTYRQLHASAAGRRRERLLVRTALEAKLAATRELPSEARPTVVRVAALVVPCTDLSWTEDGRRLHESLELGAGELEALQRAWALATAALSAFAGHGVRFETEWIRLEGVTLTGLRDRLWKGLVPQRHLDPAALRPSQEERFARLVADFDVIVFAWPRGRAAAAYGGGVDRLPGPEGRLPERGVVKSLAPELRVCLHELLHVVERRVDVPPVHGPREHPLSVFSAVGAADEIEWYAHVAASVEDWARVPYIAAASAP